MSAPFVLDASMALSWCFTDEVTPETDAVMDQLGETYAEVPALFIVEVQNILQRGERKGRITGREIDTFWHRLLSLDLRVDPLLGLSVQPFLLDLGKKYNLTAYDAAYFSPGSSQRPATGNTRPQPS